MYFNIGVEYRNESLGYLNRSFYIEATPVISPIIFILSATYGMNPQMRNERILTLDKLIAKADITTRKLNMGEVTLKDDRKIMRNRDEYIIEKKLLRDAPLSFFEVSKEIQSFISDGGLSLILDKDILDMNEIFGDPYIRMKNTVFEGDSSGNQPSAKNDIKDMSNIKLPDIITTHSKTIINSDITSTVYNKEGNYTSNDRSNLFINNNNNNNNTTNTNTSSNEAGVINNNLNNNKKPLKLLSISLLSMGHDSERLTSSIEVS